MATSSVSETDSGFDHILKNTEFENEQQLKAIKAEQERIHSCQSQLKEKQTQIVQLEKSISDLDEHAKQLHKQFLINRDNCESLKRTAVVLADHEEALKAKLSATQKEVEAERNQQSEALKKYNGIWETYKTKYESMEKAQELRRTEEQLYKFRAENTTLELEITQRREALLGLRQQETGPSLVTMVLKMANLHVETKEVMELIRTKNKQIPQLEEEVRTLQESIKVEEINRQKRQEQEQQVNVMEVDNNPPVTNTESHQPIQTLSLATSVPSLQQVVSAPKNQLPAVPPSVVAKQRTTPSRYQLKIPKLSFLPRLSSGRHQISATTTPNTTSSLSLISSPALSVASYHQPHTSFVQSPTSSVASYQARTSFVQSPTSSVASYQARTSFVQSPTISVASYQPRTSFPTPSLTVSTTQAKNTISRPSLPLLHTPTQQPPSFPLQISSRAQKSFISTSSSISLPTLTKSTLVASTNSNGEIRSQPEQTLAPLPTTAPHQQQSAPGNLPFPIGQSAEPDPSDQYEAHSEPSREFPLTPSTLGSSITSAVGEIETAQEFDIQTNDDVSFPNLFSSDNSQYFPDFRQDGQENTTQQTQPTEVQFTTEEEGGLFYGLEGSLDGHGNQPDMSATADTFMSSGFDFDQGSQSGADSSGGVFNIFSSGGDMDLARQTPQTPDFSFSFGGDGETESSSFFF